MGWRHIFVRMAKIILIDDDKFLGSILSQALTNAGHSVAIALNGFDGVALYRRDSADLILTDITMPHGGLPTIRVLRGEFPHLPIIAMSGGMPRSTMYLEIAAKIGARRALAKPFLPQELIDTVKAVLAEPPPARPSP